MFKPSPIMSCWLKFRTSSQLDISARPMSPLEPSSQPEHFECMRHDRVSAVNESFEHSLMSEVGVSSESFEHANIHQRSASPMNLLSTLSKQTLSLTFKGQRVQQQRIL
jgi:hypothetical protein